MALTPQAPENGNPLQRGEKGFLRVMGNPFLVEVLEVNAKEIRVSFPGEGYPLEGMGAQLEFHTKTGYVLYHTQVVRGPRWEGDGVVLERTEGSDERVHRRHWRVPADFPVAVRPEGDGKRYSGLLLDLGAGGMRIRMYQELSSLALLEIALGLSAGSTHLLWGRIVHQRKIPTTTPGPPFEYGVTFTDVPTETRRVLMLYLYRAIREHYPEAVQALYQGVPGRTERKG